MADVRSLLRSTLDDMPADNLGRFKSQLSHGVPDGFKPIGRGRLEDKGVVHIVELMVDTYGKEDVVKVTLHALRKTDQNDLAQTLEKNLGGSAMGRDVAQSVPPCPVGQGPKGAASIPTTPAGPQVSIQCDGGKVQAPVCSHVNVSGNMNMTFN